MDCISFQFGEMLHGQGKDNVNETEAVKMVNPEGLLN